MEKKSQPMLEDYIDRMFFHEFLSGSRKNYIKFNKNLFSLDQFEACANFQIFFVYEFSIFRQEE